TYYIYLFGHINAANLLKENISYIEYIHCILSTILLLFYIPCVYVIIKKKLILYSCYKIILFLCFIDILALIYGLCCSIFSILKISYCLAPKIHLFIGASTITLWAGSCCTAMTLVINRLIDAFNQRVHAFLFDGNKTYFWLLIPITYMVFFFFFNSSSILSIKHHVFFFDPFVDYLSHNNTIDYNQLAGPALIINNLYFLIILIILNIIYIIKLYFKTKSYGMDKNTSKLLKKVKFQVLSICFITYFTALLYISIQYLNVPEFIVFLTQFSYLFCHGSSGVIYLFFNYSIKEYFFKVIKKKKSNILEKVSKIKTVTHVTKFVSCKITFNGKIFFLTIVKIKLKFNS
ncbi:7TM GPCR, serpentine receptor class t (Srt) family-containing protein, partial [Strongyloides ratti]